jgi:hypothetical protein
MMILLVTGTFLTIVTVGILITTSHTFKKEYSVIRVKRADKINNRREISYVNLPRPPNVR